MKRVLSIVLVLALSLGALASCGPGEEPHTHTYSDKLSSDSANHWYDATCDCEDAPITKLQHIDDNNDGACDICKFTDHEHTYSEDWTVDCTNHWNAADCGHIVAGANIAAHTDENTDGKCDVCAYVINDIHEHYYSTEWTSDSEYHWHAPLCEHKTELSGKEAHNLNAAGYCTVCNEKIKDIDKTDISAVLNAALAHNYKIIDGTVLASELVYSGSGSSAYVSSGKMDDVFFVLGNGQSYVKHRYYDAEGKYTGKEEQWFELIGEDEVFGVVIDSDEECIKPAAGDAQFLNGYTYFPGSILGRDSDDTSTLANTLSGLYNIMTTGTNVSNAEENYDSETGRYSFSYSYYTVNTTMSGGEIENTQVELYGVAVEFSIDENYVINAAEFAVSVWRNWEADNDLDYNAATGEITLKDTANPSIYAYVVGQNSGERSFTTFYPKASLMPVDFELFYVTSTAYDNDGAMYVASEELIDGTLTLKKDEYVRLHLGELIPSSALASFLDISDFEITYLNKDSGAAGILWKDEDFLRPSFSGYMNCITFKVADAGEYTVTIRFGNVTKVIDITVPGEPPLVVPENTADAMYVVTTDTFAWEDVYIFTAPESGTYTFTLPAGLGMWGSKSASPEYDPFEPTGTLTEQKVTKKLAKGESFEFSVGAPTKGVVWKIGIAFEPGEVTGGEGNDESTQFTDVALIIGNNAVNPGDNINFTYTADKDGTLTLSFGAAISGNVTFSYSVNGGESVSAALISEATLELNVGDMVVITVTSEGYSSITAKFE